MAPPILQAQTPSMGYDRNRQALQGLGRDARFEDDIGYYNYGLCTADEINRMFPTIKVSACYNNSQIAGRLREHNAFQNQRVDLLVGETSVSASPSDLQYSVFRNKVQ